MRPNEIPRIDWAGRGYFAFPPDSPAPPGPAAEAPADYWLHALARARRGDFRPVLGLLDLYDEGLDPVFDQCCYYLLGDAGTTGCFALFADDAAAYTGLDFVLGCCNALAERGSLADVPLLLETYLELAEVRDAAILGVYLSDLLEEGGSELADLEGFESPAAYEAAVRARHQELVERCGGPNALVFQGKPYSVTGLAETVRDALGKPNFRMSFRRRFEAATGIDCSAFYADGHLQPLAAAAIVEEFLDSPAAAKYEPGVRYFFGHLIPD